MDKLVLSVAELANELGIGRCTAYDLVRRADFFPAAHIGNRIVVSVPALHEWLAKGGTQMRSAYTGEANTGHKTLAK